MLWDPACENMDWIYLSDPGDKPGQSRLINVQLACSIEIIYIYLDDRSYTQWLELNEALH